MLLHLGFPKCGSTSIQYFLRDRAGFIGCDVKGKPGKFYKNNLDSFFETYLRFGTDEKYRSELIVKKPIIDKYVSRFHSSKLFYSNENTVHKSLHLDVNPKIKLQRHSEVFSSAKNILITHRKPVEFIKSFYKLSITQGYSESFEDYLYDYEILSDLGYLEYLELHQLLNDLKHFFPKSNIYFVDIDCPDSIKHFFGQLGFNNTTKLSKPMNIGLKDGYLNKHLAMNRVYTNYQTFSNWIEIHRSFPELECDDEKRFRLSRLRHLHENLETNDWICEDLKFKIPKYLNVLNSSYEDFLKKHPCDKKGIRMWECIK